MKLEQLDQDVGVPLDTTGVSIDGTGQVGTYFYTAPEIEQGWPKIDEKVNLYLGSLWTEFRLNLLAITFSCSWVWLVNVESLWITG